jgi:hypothetical protein
MIYFIHDPTNRTIKIGCAWNPNRRLSTLQISTSNTLVLLGSIGGMKKAEKEVHGLVYRHCGTLPGARPLCVSGEWFDDRILPFVTELLRDPKAYLKPKKTPAKLPARKDASVHKGKLVLVFDSGETYRESFALKAPSAALALAALDRIANARLVFLAHTARITQLCVPGCRTKNVDLRGAFVTQTCKPREGVSVIFNSLSGNGYGTNGVKLYSDQRLHGLPSEFYGGESQWWFPGRVYTQPTSQFVALLTQFAQILNQNQCVITAHNPLEVRGLIARGIGALPKGRLRSKTNQKAASRYRTRRIAATAQEKTGVVYFIQDGESIKIGFCLKKPEKRLAALQTGNSNTLRLLGHVSGSEMHETLLHRHFSRFRIQGEWFSSAILAKVQEILNCSSLEEWLKRNNPEPPSPAPVGPPAV